VIHTQAKAVDDERAEKERVAGLLQTKTAEYDAKAAECEAERAEKERERAEKVALQTALDAKEAELKNKERLATRNLLARDQAQRTHFRAIADELKEVVDGRDPDFENINDRLGVHFTSLWEGMDAQLTTRNIIAGAVQSVVRKVYQLRSDKMLGGSGGERRRKRGEN